MQSVMHGSGPDANARMARYPTPENRLDSWKEISHYLRRTVRTVQRWEQSEGLPIHRIAHEKRSTVFAYKNELDHWWRSRQANKNGEMIASKVSAEKPATVESKRWNPYWILLAALAVMTGLALVLRM